MVNGGLRIPSEVSAFCWIPPRKKLVYITSYILFTLNKKFYNWQTPDFKLCTTDSRDLPRYGHSRMLEGIRHSRDSHILFT